MVERDGTLSNIKLLKDPGYGIADEIVRVLNKSPKWKPRLSKRKNRQNSLSFSGDITFRINSYKSVPYRTDFFISKKLRSTLVELNFISTFVELILIS